MNYIEQLGVNAKAAKGEIATCSTAKKNNALMEIAKQLRECCGEILEANAIDLNNAKNAGMSVSMQDRLALDEKRINAIANACENLTKLQDPVGEIDGGSVRPNGKGSDGCYRNYL